MAKRRRTVTRSHTEFVDRVPAGLLARHRMRFGGKRTMEPPSSRNNNGSGGSLAAIAVAARARRAGVRLRAVAATRTRCKRVARAIGPAAVRGPTVGPTVDPGGSQRTDRDAAGLSAAQPSGDGTTATIDDRVSGTSRSRSTTSRRRLPQRTSSTLPTPTSTTARLPPNRARVSSSRAAIPNGDGSGGPGYTIPDEPVVGDYTRGIVAMARTSAAELGRVAVLHRPRRFGR